MTKQTTPAALDPVCATCRINGTIEPGTFFRPANEKDDADLRRLEAVRDLDENERTIFDIAESKAAAAETTDADGAGEPEDGLEAVHKGGGRYQVVDRDADGAVISGDDLLPNKQAAADCIEAERKRRATPADLVG